MRPSDTVKWGVRGIKQRKLRAALTVLGIMIGTAAVIALVSQTQGIQYAIMGEVMDLGPNTINVRPSSGSSLTQIDADTISQIPGVLYVIPIVGSTVKINGAGGSESFKLLGINPEHISILVNDLALDTGRDYQDFSYSEIVVGSNVIQPAGMASPFVTVGQMIVMDIGIVNPVTKVVEVVGSFAPYGSGIKIAPDDTVFMSLEGALHVIGTNSFTYIYIKTDDVKSVDSVVDNIKALYGQDVRIETMNQITNMVNSITNYLTILLGGIATISLLVAGVGIANIMFVSVIERTREIGILKALGFNSHNVLSIFLSEAVLLGILGGILGIIVGTVVSYLMPIFVNASLTNRVIIAVEGFYFPSYSPIIQPELLIAMFSFAVAVAALAGFYPARRASKMDPVVALRHE